MHAPVLRATQREKVEERRDDREGQGRHKACAIMLAECGGRNASTEEREKVRKAQEAEEKRAAAAKLEAETKAKTEERSGRGLTREKSRREAVAEVERAAEAKAKAEEETEKAESILEQVEGTVKQVERIVEQAVLQFLKNVEGIVEQAASWSKLVANKRQGIHTDDSPHAHAVECGKRTLFPSKSSTAGNGTSARDAAAGAAVAQDINYFMPASHVTRKSRLRSRNTSFSEICLVTRDIGLVIRDFYPVLREMRVTQEAEASLKDKSAAELVAEFDKRLKRLDIEVKRWLGPLRRGNADVDPVCMLLRGKVSTREEHITQLRCAPTVTKIVLASQLEKMERDQDGVLRSSDEQEERVQELKAQQKGMLIEKYVDRLRRQHERKELRKLPLLEADEDALPGAACHMPCVCHGAACRAAVKGQGMCAVLHKGLLDLFQGNADVLTLMSAEIQCVSVKVRGQDGNIFHYVIGMKTPLKKLMEAYCSHMAVEIDRYSFHFDQNQLEETQTLQELKMEDGDVIDAILMAVHINIKVKGQDGNTVHFKMNRNTQLKKLMEAYCNRQSLQMDQIRFLFDGNRLRETYTPEELEMEDDDVIDAMLFQVGNIGIFAQHRGGIGVELLQDSTKLGQASAADARRIIDQLCPSGTPDMSALVLGGDKLVLDACSCSTLMGFMDQLREARDPRVDTLQGAHDEQVDVSEFELASLVGGTHVAQMKLLFGSTPDRITIRRVDGSRQTNLIAFHTDTGSLKTMSVALNKQGLDYDGGSLVFATRDGMLKPNRLPGSYTIHHWYMPHGVTALRWGARYGLFLQAT